MVEAPTQPDPNQTPRKSSNGSVHKPRQPKPVLAAEPSSDLRDQLLAEIAGLNHSDDLALWAHRRLPAKNTLTAEDARVVETAYMATLSSSTQWAVDQDSDEPSQGTAAMVTRAAPPEVDDKRASAAAPGPPFRKSVRARNKAHLQFVAAQPCLICQRSPCDAHHLRFAQPRTLGRKVSDEFTVPLCREHHHQQHRSGNESAWWANVQVTPLQAARDLWQATLSGGEGAFDPVLPAAREVSHGAASK